MAQDFTGVSCGDNYTNAATILDVYLSAGGVFEVQSQPAIYQLQYGYPDGHQGADFWTRETQIGVGGGSIPKGVTGIRFRNAVAGATAVASASIRGNDEPYLSLSFANPIITIPSAMQLISEIDLTVSSAFTGIPSSYRHLKIFALLRTSRAQATDAAFMDFNSDSGLNYDYHFIQGNNGAVAAASGVGANSMEFAAIPGSTALPGSFATVEITIPYYGQTVNEKTFESVNFVDSSHSAATLFNEIMGGCWRNTAAINAVSLIANTGVPWAAGSLASLYGIP